ncbi:hypothetical protein MASR2M70_22010 [Bacillota bacterium]
MDWTKAKTILIIALLVTNIFLILIYTIMKTEEKPTEEAIHAETIALLEEKRIYVKGDLPTDHFKMAVLIVEYDNVDRETIDRMISEQGPFDVEYKSRETHIKIAENFLKGAGLWDTGIVFNKIEQSGAKTVVSYRNEFEGIPVEESYINCVIEDGLVSDVERFWLKPVGFGKSKKATISASAALIDLMRSKNAGEAISVEKMEIVYWLDTSAYGGETAISDTALPAWKITYNGGQVKHVRAYND